MPPVPLKWNEFEYLPVVLQDATTRRMLMVQYMTQEGLERTVEEGFTWLWSRSRRALWLLGREGRGYEVLQLWGNCMGDSLLAVVKAAGRRVCHLGNPTCFSNQLLVRK